MRMKYVSNEISPKLMEIRKKVEYGKSLVFTEQSQGSDTNFAN